ncbi:PQQ-binding-like beta-propeller repeat protein [Streptomyces sp. NPDC060209]|uniref:outer membrane protein assembly factor BamB family protein n=1 Tax=Streptomyces sp. NPDC060209 TaxID=3347073 RepID=UPI0036655A5D
MPPHFQQLPGQPGGPDGSKKRRTAVIAGCVTAALAVLAAGTLAFLHFNDGQQSAADGKGNAPVKASQVADPTQSRVLLNVPPPPEKVEEEGHRGPGAWVTSHSYVSGGPDSILGYDLDSGKPTWTLPLDGDLCRASKEVTSKGYVAVVFAGSKKPYSKCTQIAVIDINQGRKVWQKSVPKAHRGLDLSVAVSENFAAAGWSDEGSWGFAVDTGKTVWDSPPPGCDYEEYLGGSTLTGLTWCNDHFAVSQRDPRTGKPSRTVKLPEDVGYPYLASADPLVVASYVGDEDNQLDANRIWTFNTDGSVKATIKVDDYIPGCQTGTGTGCGALVVTQDTLYLASRPEHITSGNHIAAFDASTGKRKWTVDGAGWSEMRPLRADKDGLIFYNLAGQTRDGSGVFHLAAADGKQTVLLKQPFTFEVADTTEQMISRDMDEPVIYEDGRIFFHKESGYFQDEIPMNYALTTH